VAGLRQGTEYGVRTDYSDDCTNEHERRYETPATTTSARGRKRVDVPGRFLNCVSHQTSTSLLLLAALPSSSSPRHEFNFQNSPSRTTIITTIIIRIILCILPALVLLHLRLGLCSDDESPGLTSTTQCLVRRSSYALKVRVPPDEMAALSQQHQHEGAISCLMPILLTRPGPG
jgi:hypothetical protein